MPFLNPDGSFQDTHIDPLLDLPKPWRSWRVESEKSWHGVWWFRSELDHLWRNKILHAKLFREGAWVFGFLQQQPAPENDHWRVGWWKSGPHAIGRTVLVERYAETSQRPPSQPYQIGWVAIRDTVYKGRIVDLVRVESERVDDFIDAARNKTLR
jgi:hypothetical protein